MQKAATVYRYGSLETTVKPGHDTRQIAAPTDPGDCCPIRVDLPEAADERVSQDDIRNRVRGPNLIQRPSNGAEFLSGSLVGAAVWQRLPASAFAGQIHSDGRVAPLRPQFDPLREYRASTAVHQHNCRQAYVFRRIACESARGCIEGINARLLAITIWQ